MFQQIKNLLTWPIDIFYHTFRRPGFDMFLALFGVGLGILAAISSRPQFHFLLLALILVIGFPFYRTRKLKANKTDQLFELAFTTLPTFYSVGLLIAYLVKLA